MNKKDIKNLISLFIISITAFLSDIWVREPDLMEQRNFIAAREMVLNKSYLIPTLNGALRFEKPPLPTWFTAIIMKLTHNFTDEWILRIPSVLCGILFIFSVYYFVRLLTNDTTKSFFSGFVASTTFMIIKVSGQNNWDIYVHTFTFGAIMFLLYGLKLKKVRYFILSGISLGLSIMSKGPVGIYSLFIPFLISYILIFGTKEFKANWKYLLILLLITLCIASVWPLFIYNKYPNYFTSVLVKEENTWSTKHTQGFLYYLDYFAYSGIWIFFAIFAIFKKYKAQGPKKYSHFLLLWNFLVLLFLSIISMKKKRYGIPIYMISSLNVGILCDYYWQISWDKLKKIEKNIIYLQFGTILFISSGLIFFFTYIICSNKNINLLYSFSSIILYLYILYYLYTRIKRDSIHRFSIIFSGLFMVIVNLNASWLIDKTFIKKEFPSKYVSIETFQKTPSSLDIYSNNFSIDEVWNVGKKIIPITPDKTFPNKFIVLGDIPTYLNKDFNLLKSETYSKKDGDILKLHYLAKKD